MRGMITNERNDHTTNGRNDYDKSAETLAETLESWSVGGYNGNVGFCSLQGCRWYSQSLENSDSVWSGAQSLMKDVQ